MRVKCGYMMRCGEVDSIYGITFNERGRRGKGIKGAMISQILITPSVG